MKILAIIPARGGSKGIPGKNIKLLGGKPLLAYTIEKALQSTLLHTVMVSTDDTKIAKVAGEYGLPVPFMRPAKLARDNSPSIDLVQHALSNYAGNSIFFDAVMLLEPTSPFRDDNEIDECIRLFTLRKSDSFVTVRKVPDAFNPYWIFEESPDSRILKTIVDQPVIQRRQSLPATYVRDGSIYITKTDIIRKQNSLFGQSISYKVKNSVFRVNIDSKEDWAEAERILELTQKITPPAENHNLSFVN